MIATEVKAGIGESSAGSQARIMAVFGPTSVGKTGVVLEIAQILRERGHTPVAVNCDSAQIYQGLETISGSATAEERERLEHRILGEVPPGQEMSAGRYAAMAHREIDGLLEAGNTPLVVGGTGLWLRAALCDLELQPPVPDRVKAEVEAELARKGGGALHAELPSHLSERVHPNDTNRIVRWTSLVRIGAEPMTDSSGLWTADTRHPTRLIGLIADRTELSERIDRRVEEMAGPARQEAREILSREISRTAAAAIGIEEFARGDLDPIKTQHRAYAKRQVTWMRKLPGVELLDRSGLSDLETARMVMDGR